MAYRDELEALRARVAAAEAERDAARAEAQQLKRALSLGVTDVDVKRTRQVRPEWRSIPGGEPLPVRITNESRRKIAVYWLSYEGKERRAGTLVPGGSLRQVSYVGFCWRFVDPDTGAVLGHARVEPAEDLALLVFRG